MQVPRLARSCRVFWRKLKRKPAILIAGFRLTEISLVALAAVAAATMTTPASAMASTTSATSTGSAATSSSIASTVSAAIAATVAATVAAAHVLHFVTVKIRLGLFFEIAPAFNRDRSSSALAFGSRFASAHLGALFLQNRFT